MADLPIAATAAGNHDFDDGVDALLDGARSLGYPMLCANVDVGLAPSALLDTPAGPVGAIGLGHPDGHRFTAAPPVAEHWPQRVAALAQELRRDGARWVVALLHAGVTWWPSGESIATRSAHLETVAAPWARAVDLIVAGHDFAHWTGRLGGTPAGEANLFASSVLVVDLPAPPARAMVRGVFRVPPIRPATVSPVVRAYDAAAARVVAESPEPWITRPGAARYLPDLIARAFRASTGAEAAFVPPTHHAAQAPLDGAIGQIRAGPVTELDVVRLFPGDGYAPVVAELRPGELRTVVERHSAIADPREPAGDALWWNWCRLPAGVSTVSADPASLALLPANVRLLDEWLGRELAPEPAGVTAGDALIAQLTGRAAAAYPPGAGTSTS